MGRIRGVRECPAGLKKHTAGARNRRKALYCENTKTSDKIFIC